MELIYIYVEKFSDFIKQQEFLLSQKFDVNYDKEKGHLLINKKEYIKDFFGENIKNISLVIGKNGTGKTTFLDLLGMKRDDRVGSHERCKDEYFFLYHIKNNIFAIEGYGLQLIKDIVTNLPFEDKFPITDPYSIVVETNINSDCTYNYVGFMQSKLDDNQKQINDRIIYVNIREKYNDRYSESAFINKEDYTVFANRFYGNEIGIKEKYSVLNFLTRNQKELINEQKEDKVDFLNTNVHITIESKFNYYAKDEKKLDIKLPKKLFRKGFRSVKEFNEERNQETPEKQNDIKKRFVLKFLEKNIHESFNEGILENIKNENEDIINIKNKEIIDMQKAIDILYLSIKNENIYENQVKYLLGITKMINDRVENYIELGSENEFYNAIADFVKCLDEIKRDYFEDGKINIPLNIEVDEQESVLKLLDIIDKYSRNNKNNLENNIKIEFRNLSEGESEFIDFFARLRESLKNPNVIYGDTVILILDEPDKSFHPEWSRRFIPILLENISKIENVESKYQIIISTHSPFMVSDMPSDNLILLDSKLDEKVENRCLVKNKKDVGKTFANNIHTILSNEFFIKSTIGEFAKTKIQQIIKFMMDYQKFENEKLKDIPDKFEEQSLREKKKEIKYIIEIIGEPLIKRKLEEMYRTTFPEKDIDYKSKIEKLEKDKKQLEKILGDKGIDKIESVMQLLKKEIDKLRLEDRNSL